MKSELSKVSNSLHVIHREAQELINNTQEMVTAVNEVLVELLGQKNAETGTYTLTQNQFNILLEAAQRFKL